MIRILLIGRESEGWAQRLQARAGDELELDTARLPAAGLRQFEATPPDALVVIDSASTKRAATLIAAVRERPIGQLIPVIAIAPPPGGDERAEVDAWLSPNVDVGRLASALEECLGVELSAGGHAVEQAPRNEPVDQGPAPSTFSTPSPSVARRPQQDRNQPSQPSYFIEEIDDHGDRPRRLDRDSIFSSRQRKTHERQSEKARVDQEAVERKLKAVRHEDYYAILEIRRGAEGAVVREAFHRLYRRFDPREIDFEVAHHLEDTLAEIRDALEDAWAVLGDPKLRQAYLEHTTRR